MFKRLCRAWLCWARDDRGQDLVEFALLAALAGVASGLFMPSLTDNMDVIYSKIASKLTEAGG